MTEAIKYFRTGAEKGNAECQVGLGLTYQAGEKIPGGVTADPTEAAKWYRMAADQNNTEAILHLAGLYKAGEGVEQSDAEAFKWFSKGAELGNPESLLMLSGFYKKGISVEKNSVMAYALISAAVEAAQDPEQKNWMAETRDKIGLELNPEQMKQAQILAQEWIAKRKKQ